MSRPADPNAKDALVAAARAEFARRGLRGARIEDITAACGLSKGAFYLHFESKEALFGELVEAFSCETANASGLRRRIMAKIVDQYGPLTRRDVEQRSPHYRALVELEQAEDYRLLEHIWAYRDVVGVLVAGAQGTVFETTFWDMAEREVSRIKEDVGNFQQHHACRTDIPAEVFGSLIVGTWLLLGMRMSKMTEKPDLAEWARSIHTLIREGSLPPQAKRGTPTPQSRAALQKEMPSTPSAPTSHSRAAPEKKMTSSPAAPTSRSRAAPEKKMTSTPGAPTPHRRAAMKSTPIAPTPHRRAAIKTKSSRTAPKPRSRR